MDFSDLRRTLMALIASVAADFRRGYAAVRKRELNGQTRIFSLEIK